MWMDALTNEMRVIGLAFEILEDDKHLLVGYKKSSEYLIFDVKMGFT